MYVIGYFQTKKWNRLSEFLLSDAEILSSVAALVTQSCDAIKQYPLTEITRLWKLALLNQFHDVLPGTSIKDVGINMFVNSLIICF